MVKPVIASKPERVSRIRCKKCDVAVKSLYARMFDDVQKQHYAKVGIYCPMCGVHRFTSKLGQE